MGTKRTIDDVAASDRNLALLAAIVASSDDAIVSKTLDGRVTSWNRAAERIFGYSSAEMLGRPITVIFPADRVRDSGIGIPTDMLARVFDPFTQVSRPLDRAHSGLGVGLTLVKRLIELHGGRITADSEGTGHGSEFVIHLPLLDGRTVSGSGASADAGASGTATSRRVLVVDDNDRPPAWS